MTDVTIKMKPIYAYYLLLVESVKHMQGTCQKKINYHWPSCGSWRPKGTRHVFRAFGKMSGIDYRRFARSPHPLRPLLSRHRTPL